MDPLEKGWLYKYLEIKLENFNRHQYLGIPSSEKELYAYLQPTGILYGHPLNLPEELPVAIDQWPVKERMKVILAESLINSGLIDIPNEEIGKSYLDKLLQAIGKNGTEFYQQLNPELKPSKWHFWKHPEGIEMAEYILDKRITVKASWNANFWQGFFHNILLFTDIIQFTRWLRSDDKTDKDLALERENIRLDALRLIAASAYADNVLKTEEKRLYKYFLESADLNAESKSIAEKFIQENIQLDELNLDHYDSWLLRKYLLELSILTIWADRNISEKETDFLKSLAFKLRFDEEELEKSLIGVESFVLNNWDKVHYLQTKQNYLILSNRLSSRMGKIAGKYKNQIKNEILESNELIQLLNKSRNESLSIEEKGEIREQLIDIMKTIPAFIIITLPFTFLTLPILFKILPKSVFPSSFDQNRLFIKKSRRFIDS